MHSFPRQRAVMLLALFVLFGLGCGCGDGGLPRHQLTGKVTYQGRPVPMGRIVFEPDTSKGNDGPQGYTSIENGAYGTDRLGKGAMVGPLIVRIVGYEKSATPAEEGPPPKMLFPPYVTRIDLSEDTTTVDFEIPVSGGQH